MISKRSGFEIFPYFLFRILNISLLKPPKHSLASLFLFNRCCQSRDINQNCPKLALVQSCQFVPCLIDNESCPALASSHPKAISATTSVDHSVSDRWGTCSCKMSGGTYSNSDNAVVPVKVRETSAGGRRSTTHTGTLNGKWMSCLLGKSIEKLVKRPSATDFDSLAKKHGWRIPRSYHDYDGHAQSCQGRQASCQAYQKISKSLSKLIKIFPKCFAKAIKIFPSVLPSLSKFLQGSCQTYLDFSKCFAKPIKTFTSILPTQVDHPGMT